MRVWRRAAVIVLAALTATLVEAESPDVVRPALPLGLDLYLPVPEANELSPEKVALGRRLFFHPILSRDGSLACASCHQPERAFTDGRARSVGVLGREGPRNVPTLVNRAYGRTHFWDGRAATLEEQVVQPIQDPKELDLPLEEAVARLRADEQYAAGFREAFGREPNAEDLARALASYVRTILSGDAPIDRYMVGGREALPEEARRGLQLFRGKANCVACHLGPIFTDEQFHNTGVAWRNGRPADEGRAAVTGREEDRGAFRTPTLREVARTAPYMHDGSLATLEEVIDFYNRGGNPNPYLDPGLKPLNLTEEEVRALLAFLGSLSGEITAGLVVPPAKD